MWPSHIAKPLKKAPIKRSADDTDDWARKGFGEMRSRHPMFRMPNWMSEDEDVSNLASRMSQTPHFSSMGRRAARPGRERRHSGGSAVSGTSEEDSVDGPHTDRSSQSSGSSFRHDPTPVTIPIRIEAEAPPGYEPPHSGSPLDRQNLQEKHPQQPQQAHTAPQLYPGDLRKQPQYASRTSPAVDAIKQEDLPRDARSSSAPPDVTDQVNDQPQKFVSKINITPQSVNDRPFSTSPVFNNVAKPYVSSHKQEKTPPKQEEQFSGISSEFPVNSQGQHYNMPTNQQFSQPHPQNQSQYSQQPQHYPEHQQFPQQNHPPQQHWGGTGQKSSVVRNIPIIFEGRDEPVNNSSTATSRSPPPNQHSRSHPGPQRDHPFMNASYGFPPHGFSGIPSQDPFFNFPSGCNSQKPNYQQPQHHQTEYGQNTQPNQQTQSTPRESSPQPNHTNIPKHEDPSPQSPKDIKMEKISVIRQSITEYQEMAKKFQGTEKNKEFLYIDEMLTRALLQLDDIDPDGREDVRKSRRTLIKDINDTIAALERKITDVQGENLISENQTSETLTSEKDNQLETPQVEDTKMEEDNNISEKQTEEAALKALVSEDKKAVNPETLDATPAEADKMEVDQDPNEDASKKDSSGENPNPKNKEAAHSEIKENNIAP